MKRVARQTIRCVRRVALIACIAAWIASCQGILTAGKGRWVDPVHAILLTADGAVGFVQVHPTSATFPPADSWQIHYEDRPRYVQFFNWQTLGFMYVSEYQPGPWGAPFHYFGVMAPYWAIVAVLLVPEILILGRYFRARAIRVIPETKVEARIVEQDLPCVHCGYNVRTRATTERCPECGALISDTLELNRELARSRPGWLRMLAVGNLLLVLARGMLLGIYATAFFERMDAAAILAIVIGVLYVAGIDLLTQQEHPYLKSPDRKMARRQRILALLSFALLLAALWDDQWGPNTRPWELHLLGLDFSGSGHWKWPMILLTLGAWLTYCVGLVLEFRFLGQLATRVLDRPMREHARIVGVGAAVTNGLAILGVSSVMRASWVWATSKWQLYAICALVVVWMLFVIWAGIVNLYCALRFIEQSWIAQERWRSQAAIVNCTTVPGA